MNSNEKISDNKTTFMMIKKKLHKLMKDYFQRQIGREMLVSMGLKFSRMGLVFLGTVLLARILGPSDYGVYSYVFAIISIISIPSQFGLPTLVVRETASGVAQKKYSQVQGVWRWSGKMVVIISIFLIAFSGLYTFLYKYGEMDVRSETFLWGLALVPLIALGNLRGAALRGLKKIVAGQVPESLILPGLFAALLASSFFFYDGIISASIAMSYYAVASAAAFVVGALLLWKATPPEVSQAVPQYKIRIWFLSALPLAFIGGMQLINQQASILMQGFYLSDAEIGVFRVAVQVSVLAAFGLNTVNIVTAPYIAALFSQGDIKGLQHLVKRSAQVILVFNIVITLGLVLLGKFLIYKLYGESYILAYLPMIILLIGQLINSGVGSVGILLNMTHHEQETVKSLVVSVIFNIVLNFLLLPRYGIIGSSISIAVSLIIWNGMQWISVKKKLGLNSSAFSLSMFRKQ